MGCTCDPTDLARSRNEGTSIRFEGVDHAPGCALIPAGHPAAARFKPRGEPVWVWTTGVDWSFVPMANPKWTSRHRVVLPAGWSLVSDVGYGVVAASVASGKPFLTAEEAVGRFPLIDADGYEIREEIVNEDGSVIREEG